MSENNSSPIFIVGSPRSGTTLLRLILDSHPSLSSGPETQFLADFHKIVGRHWYRIKRFGFNKQYWHLKISSFFNEFQMEYAIRRGKKRWVEKSPNYIHHLDFINDLFPSCKIIHIIRDGRDVVASHRDRWGYRSALQSAKSWPNDIRAAQEFGRKVNSERYLEIKYENLVSTPEQTLKLVFNYIKEPWDPVVLNYASVDHDKPEWLESFTDKRRKESNDTSLIYNSRIGTGINSLDPVLKLAVYLYGRKTLRSLGYM